MGLFCFHPYGLLLAGKNGFVPGGASKRPPVFQSECDLFQTFKET